MFKRPNWQLENPELSLFKYETPASSLPQHVENDLASTLWHRRKPVLQIFAQNGEMCYDEMRSTGGNAVNKLGAPQNERVSSIQQIL